MAAISFCEEENELRITEILKDNKIRISCENNNNDFISVHLDREDMAILIDWLSKQTEKIHTPTTNA